MAKLLASNKPKPRVVFLGHVCIDHNRSEHATYTSWGSPALYMADYLKRCYNIKSTVITSYGADLLQHAPHFDLLPVTANAEKTMVYENVTHSGRRTQRCYRNGAADEPTLDSEAIAALASADIVVVAPLTADYSPGYVKQVLQHVPLHCLVVCCPQGYFRSVDDTGHVKSRVFEEALDVVGLCDFVVLSEDDHSTAMQQAISWSTAESNCKIVITQGGKGASLVAVGGLKPIPTNPILEKDVIDSVGCGDVFAAATMVSLYYNGNITQAIIDGHAAAHDKLLSVNTSAIVSS